MKILLTGGTGYIGSHTAVELISRGHEVEILDNLVNSKITALDNIEKISNVKPKFYFVDLLDKENLDKTMAVNNVSAVVFDWRGFDTLGESFILLTAIAGSFVILGVHRKKTAAGRAQTSEEMKGGDQE